MKKDPSVQISATASNTSQPRNSKADQPMWERIRMAYPAALLLLLLLIATFVSFYRYPETALAQPAEGTLLRTLTIPGSSGVGVGFDGTNLYWLDFSGGTLHKITTSGTFVADIPIVGCTATAISWDATRGIFWGASGKQISKITTAGVCTPWFNVAAFLPGNCNNGFGCLDLIDGINYDPFDDSIWYSPDASQRIYHYNIPSTPIPGRSRTRSRSWMSTFRPMTWCPSADSTTAAALLQASGISCTLGLMGALRSSSTTRPLAPRSASSRSLRNGTRTRSVTISPSLI